jgi:hypothetical protein
MTQIGQIGQEQAAFAKATAPKAPAERQGEKAMSRDRMRLVLVMLLAVLVVTAAFAASVGGRNIFTMVSATKLGMERGVGMSVGLGKIPMVQAMEGVAALDVDGVHAAITIPTYPTVTTVVTAITDPVHYRNITITGSAANALSAVEIIGTNWADEYQSESITGTGAATVQGLLPFKTVDTIKVSGVAVPAASTYTIGWGDYLGLYRPIAADADVTSISLKASAGTAWVVTAAGALPVGAAVSALYDTVLPETTITAVDSYLICYNAEAW